MPLTKNQLPKNYAFALYTLLASDSTSRHFIISGQFNKGELGPSDTKVYQTLDELRQALVTVIKNSSGQTINIDDEDLSGMLPNMPGPVNLSPNVIHKSFANLAGGYGMGSCPREKSEEQCLWNAAAGCDVALLF